MNEPFTQASFDRHVDAMLARIDATTGMPTMYISRRLHADLRRLGIWRHDVEIVVLPNGRKRK